MMKIKLILLTSMFCFLCLPSWATNIVLDNGQRSAQDLKRDVTSKPVEIITFAGIKPGMVVADLFAGGGYYSELLAQMVGPKGKVYLFNNEPYIKFVGKELMDRLKDNRLANVIDYQRDAEAIGFEDNSLDAVFFVLGYHDFYHKSQDWSVDGDKVINQMAKALKPGGLMLVVDHAAPDGTGTAHSQLLHRIDEGYVKKHMADKGFELVKSADLLRNADDTRLISPFIPEIRRRTDRFVLLFRKTTSVSDPGR